MNESKRRNKQARGTLNSVTEEGEKRTVKDTTTTPKSFISSYTFSLQNQNTYLHTELVKFK